MIKLYNLMKTLNYAFWLLSFSLIATSCSKEKDQSNPYGNETNTTDFASLVIPQTFNWSSSIKGNLEVLIKAPSYLKTENQPVELVDEEGNVLEEARVINGSANFYISVPKVDEANLYVRYPNTQEEIKITAAGKISFQLSSINFDGLHSNLFKPLKKTASVKAKTNALNMIVDGDFENATFLLDSASYTTLRTAGNWYTKNNFYQIITAGGSKVLTSGNSSKTAEIFQSFNVSGDEIFDFEYDYAGNAGFYVLFFDASHAFIGYTTVYNNGGQGYAHFQTSATVKSIQIYGFSAVNNWLDNVSLSKEVETDTDGDGVPDRKDAFPLDPNRAYISYYPQIGSQTLAFEDLWPATGDYDFNDLVLSNRVEFHKNAAGNLVDATVSIKVLGMGAGESNGLAINFVKSNHSALSSNIISSVNGAGATLDPQNGNGVIAINDLRKALTPFYNNNGVGPNGTPQEFVFTVTFNSNAGSQFLVPDFFMFKTNNRAREIHLPGFTGSPAADVSLYNTKADVNGTYKTKNGLPWVIEIVHPNTKFFHHPKEKVDICVAYPQFQKWAESNGSRYIGWMIFPDKNKVFYIK